VIFKTKIYAFWGHPVMRSQNTVFIALMALILLPKFTEYLYNRESVPKRTIKNTLNFNKNNR